MDMGAICGIAQGGVVKESDKLKERRSCAVQEEGIGDQFALILQSFMPLQTACSWETSGRQEGQGSGIPLLESMPSALQDLSCHASWKPISAVLKGEGSLLGPQMPDNEAFQEFSEAFQKLILPGGQNALPSHQVHSVFERIDGVGGIPDQGTSPLHSAGDRVSDGTTTDESSTDWGMHAASDIFAHEGKLEVKGMLASGVRAYDGLQYIAEEATDAQLAMGLKKDSDAIGSYSQLDVLESVALKSQSLKNKSVSAGLKQHIENVELESSIIGVDGMDEAMHNSADGLGDAKGEPHLNFSASHEGHAWGRLYAAGQLQPVYSDEMNPVFDEKLINLHQALAEIADRVRVLLSARRSEMEVRLKPPELGKMVVNVAMENGTLAVRITVESNFVKDFIQAHVQELKMLLAQEGYALVDIDVNIGQSYQQPQHDGVGNGWRFENPVSRKTKASVLGIQQGIVRLNAYYHEYHSFDCLA